jgi:hypothetical protein
LSYCEFLCRETTSVAGKIGQDEDSQDGDKHGNGTLD